MPRPLTGPSGGASRPFAHERIEGQPLSPTPEADARSQPLFRCPAPTPPARRWKTVGLLDSRTRHSCCDPHRIRRRSSFPECKDSCAAIWSPKQPATAAGSPLKTSVGRLRVFRASASHMCYMTPILRLATSVYWSLLWSASVEIGCTDRLH